MPAALSWQSIGGGALAPLAGTVSRLWDEALGAQRAVGWDLVGPADPFSAVVAALGTLSPADPSRAMVILWLLALPLAVLGGWFAATRLTEVPALRVVGAVIWALAPTFLIALADGRPAAVIVHLVLPWLAFTASAAHRSWGNAGTASILLAVAVACSPLLAAPAAVVWVFALVAAAILRGRRAGFRWAWIAVPTIALAAPIVLTRVAAGDAWSLLADPGVPWPAAVPPADLLGQVLVAAGFPTDAGWGAFTGQPGASWWLALFTAPVMLLGLAAAASPRRFVGIVLLAIGALGTVSAFAAADIAVSVAGTSAVALWPGTALSVAWIGFAGGAVLVLDSVTTRVVVRALAASVAVAGLVLGAVPSLTAQTREAATVGRGDLSTLPAFVAAAGTESPGVGTVVLTPTADGVAADVVWGGSETIGGQSTLRAARTSLTPADAEFAQVVADLVADTATDVVGQLREHGVGFVLIAPESAGESGEARSLRLSATTALNSRAGLDSVGQTDTGELWRLSDGVAPRADAPASAVAALRAAWTAIAVVFAIALLLSLPTRGSRSASRTVSRVVGAGRLRSPSRGGRR